MWTTSLYELLRNADEKLFYKMKSSNHSIHQLLPPAKTLPMKLRTTHCVFALPQCNYNLYKSSFVLRNFFWTLIEIFCFYTMFITFVRWRLSVGITKFTYLLTYFYIWFEYRRVERLRLPIKGLNVWRFDNTIRDFGPIVHCACTGTPIYELPVKNLTSPFASATPISCNRGITLLSEHIFAIFWRFL